MIITPPRTGSVDLVVTAPPSKSYTHRALIIGALASGTTILLQPLFAQDTRLTLDALRMLGVPITVNPDEIVITGCNGRFPTGKNDRSRSR